MFFLENPLSHAIVLAGIVSIACHNFDWKRMKDFLRDITFLIIYIDNILVSSKFLKEL
jgi:hypothetical protein